MRDHSSSACRAALLAGALALAALAIHRAGDNSYNQYISNVSECKRLPGRALQLCSSYHTAVGPEKFTAAVHWRQLSPSTYACSGITVDCLQADMRNRTGSRCVPLQDGEACDEQQQLTCSKGFCGGRPRNPDPIDPSFQPGVSSSFAPVTFTAPQQQQQQQQQQQDTLGRAKSLIASLLTSASSGPAADVSHLGHPRSLQAVSAQVDPNWPTAVGVVKFRDGQRRVPEGFLATSHEWTRLTDYGGENAAAWAEIFKVLGPSPVLRIGGATQDKLIDVPKDETWVALKQLQKLTNARFIIGLPLFQKDAVEMCQQMIGQAKKYLGSSVIGFELGNEPEFWPSGLGGYDEKGEWQSGFGPYTKWFDKVAKTLNPCGTTPFLSGPGWGNLNTQDPNWLKIVLNNGKSCGYLWEANSHYYPYINNATVTAEQLLSQPLQDVGLERLQAYTKIAWDGFNLDLRISEANSLYGGGRADLSDTMAGTLWVADALFAFAANGARAFHLHWGHGGLPFQGGSPNVGVQTNFDYNTPYPYKPYPSVHAPWYGYLFWVMASAGGYSRNADTQFTAAWIEKKAPPPPPAPAPSSSNTSGSSSSSGSTAPANVVTEKGSGQNKTSSSSSSGSSKQTSSSSNDNKRFASPDALRAYWRQQLAAGQHRTQAGEQQQQQGRKLLQSTGACDANIKLWALKAGDNTLRIAILNKDSNKNCNVKVTIADASHLCKEGQKAELSRLLPGPQGMSSKSGLSWQGQHYDDSSSYGQGKLVGDKATATVTATKDGDGCGYLVGMPKSSGALLIINA